MIKTSLREGFTEIFGRSAEPKAYRAPGRVNLIGEHTDYNGGLVLPMAVNLSTYVLIRKTTKEIIRLYSANLEEYREIKLSEVTKKKNDWSDYIRGILSGLREEETGAGFDLYIDSEVPVGSGLSSSAALEIAVANSLNESFDLNLTDLDLIRLCQRAENDFVGANTGIMDQYVSYFAREGKALLIDTVQPSHRPVNLKLNKHELLVIDTTVSHAHGEGEYNKRREECRKALKIINQEADGKFDSLGQLSIDDWHDFEPSLPDRLGDRVEHVVKENRRVKEAAESLQRGDVRRTGTLFFDSHKSLRDLYEVSSPELDFLVDFAEKEKIPGSRMTGGGFGGSTIHLVPQNYCKNYLAKAEGEFENEFDRKPKGFPVKPENGAKAKPYYLETNPPN